MDIIRRLEDLSCMELSQLKTDDPEIIDEINRILSERVDKIKKTINF